MQIMNAISSNLFDSYQSNKKEASEKAQIVSRFMDTESQKVDEAELATRPKIEELQSHVEQMKKEYLEGRKEVCDWANDSLELRLNRNSLSLEEVEKIIRCMLKCFMQYMRIRIWTIMAGIMCQPSTLIIKITMKTGLINTQKMIFAMQSTILKKLLRKFWNKNLKKTQHRIIQIC